MQYFFKYLEDKDIYLNSQQKKIVSWDEKELLVLACPGSGKTTVLNARIAYMLKIKGVNPKNILALTFSRAAAKEMNDRFYNIYGDIVGEGLSFSTIHSFCFKILRSYYRKSKIRYELIEGGASKFDKRSLLQDIYKSINGKKINDDKLEELLNAISSSKNNPNFDIQDSSFNIPNFDKVFNAYEDFKRNNKYGLLLLDFDDLLLEGYNLLNQNEYYIDNCRKYYRYILVDEGQDTSLIQNKIIETIARNHRNLFIVCDDDQSIYRFRGAEPEYLLNFKDRYPTGEVINLDINYRSTQSIIKTARAFIENNKSRYNKSIVTDNKTGDRVRIVNVPSYAKQKGYIIEEIKNSLRIETAILYRNNISAIELANELTKEGISYFIRDYHKSFFNHWILNDILNIMRFSNDDSSVNLLQNIYTKIDSYISKAEIAYIKELKYDGSVFDKLITFPEMKEFKKKNMKELKQIFQSFKTMEPLKIISFIRHQLNYDSRLKKYSEIAGYSYENLRLILNTIEGIAKDSNDMFGFVDNLNDLKLSMYQASKNKNSKVILSTLHSSKGMEFDRVIMYDLYDEIIPSKDSIKNFDNGDPRDMEEDRRLWYVGMTRARYDLRLLKVKSDIYDKSPSRFFREIGALDTVDHVNAESSEAITVNTTVRHTSFGVGCIEKIVDENICINFQDVGRKTLSLTLCRERNLIEII